MVSTRSSKTPTPIQPTTKKTPTIRKTRPSIVSAERKKTMGAYNDKISNTRKNEYRKNKIVNLLKSGKQKTIQKATLSNFTWTEDEQIFLKGFLKPASANRTKFIEKIVETLNDDNNEINNISDDDDDMFQGDDEEEIMNNLLENEEEHERLLTTAKVTEFMNNRSKKSDKTNNKNRLLVKQLANMAVKIFGNKNVVNKDYRKVLNFQPQDYLDIIKNGKKYAKSSLLTMWQGYSTITREYKPAKDYIKTMFDFKKYQTDVQDILKGLSLSLSSESISKKKNEKVKIEELYKSFTGYFEKEEVLFKKRLDSPNDNMKFLVNCIYTYGIFEKDIDYLKVGYVPRNLSGIELNTMKREGEEGLWYNKDKGTIFVKGDISPGVQSHKTSGRYSYAHKYIPYVVRRINESLNIDTKIRKELLPVNEKSIYNWIGSINTYRHTFDSVLNIMNSSAENIERLSNAFGHDASTSYLTYQASIIFGTEKNKSHYEKKFKDFFKTIKQRTDNL